MGGLDGDGGGHTVFVFDEAVVEDTRHGYAGAGEVGVEVEATRHRRSGRRVLGVARQETEDVVAAAVPRLDDQAQVGRQGTVVGRARRLVVFVGLGYVVTEFAGALFELTFAVGLGVVFVFFGHGFHFVDGVGLPDEDAPGDAG